MASCGYGEFTDKTLVSWVTLEDKSVTGGSLITLLQGDYDGMFFAREAENRWMAGSGQNKRTETNQEKNAEETSDEMIQMAIVYKGKKITIYRNGDVYSSYQMNGEPKAFNDNVTVTIGKEHAKDMGGIGGAIEDCRVYDQALTQDQIRALKPNIESEIKPYLWWNFEDNNPAELTGRLPAYLLHNEACVKEGKLLLTRGGSLVAGKNEQAAHFRSPKPFLREPYVADTPRWPDNPPDNWPIYHLLHPETAQAPFDPNTAIYYKGRYHLHYIYRNKYGFSFAHVSSRDMVHWKWHPTTLAPPNNGHGMFSGTGFFTKEGKVAHTYFGEGSNRNWIQYALDDNLEEWSNPEVMLPRDTNGKLLNNAEYFDPDIWIMDDKYYGLNGRSWQQSPVVMKSDNLKEWVQYGELLHPNFDEEQLGVCRDEDISCPNFFKLGDKWILLCISHGLGCRYFVGDFVDGKYLPESHAILGGVGRQYFAPESLLTPDGRRVYWAWILYSRQKGGGGLQSLPTEMKLAEDGTMLLRPVKELESLRYDEKKHKTIVVAKNETKVLSGIKDDHLEIKLEVKNPGDGSFGVHVLCDENGKEGIPVRVNRKNKQLEIDQVRGDFELKEGEPLTLRIFVDATIVEVFANDRQVVMRMTRRDAGEKFHSNVALFSEGADLTVDTVTAWKMKSAF